MIMNGHLHPLQDSTQTCWLLVLQWNLSYTDTLGLLKCVLINEVSSFQGANITYIYM